MYHGTLHRAILSGEGPLEAKGPPSGWILVAGCPSSGRDPLPAITR
jgi:hypothetical protein